MEFKVESCGTCFFTFFSQKVFYAFEACVSSRLNSQGEGACDHTGLALVLVVFDCSKRLSPMFLASMGSVAIDHQRAFVFGKNIDSTVDFQTDFASGFSSRNPKLCLCCVPCRLSQVSVVQTHDLEGSLMVAHGGHHVF